MQKFLDYYIKIEWDQFSRELLEIRKWVKGGEENENIFEHKIE